MKQFIKKYGHIWLLSYGFIYLPWFGRLQQNMGQPYHVIHVFLDDFIPFCEYFIVPYLLWFLYVGAAIAYFFFADKEGYYRLCTFLFVGMTVSLLVCTLYPNGTDFRPVIDPNQSIFTKLVSTLWSIDPPINVFPSIHVYNSLGVHIAVCNSKRLSQNKKLVTASGVLMAAICLSTVFLKQHSIMDGIASMVMAAAVYPLAYAPAAAKKKKVAKETYNA